ncbi:hypothetical protein CERSUDRAFT_75722 [Gelatoporia subvermispora B]|uniref:F-box domain-containing protein n=1 Tax=Ceriporiopsis subvermispora (strain B) TaxID=914234 RepID=M2R8Q2_CERS8|nr:hypothetical protein CERSUDRAFT_75722 [Gelatoporia subvermispora B]
MNIDPSLGPSSEQADANFPSPPGLEVEEPGPVLAVPQNPEPDAPATHQPYLPPEITDDILDYLDAESDGPTLRACALAGRVLHPRARANLFRTLYITKPRDCGRAAAWFAEPQYARCVQHLMLNQSALESGSDEWDDETTAALLRCFHPRSGEEQDCSDHEMGDTCTAGVKTLVMYWIRVEEMPLTTAVLAIPSVTTLTFAYLSFTKPEDFRLFMNGFPALERLTIGGICVGEASVPWNPSRDALPSVPMPRLYRLDLSRMRETNHCEELILQWLLDQELEDIHIKWLGYIGFRNGLELPPAVLKALGASVEHLCMGHEMCEVFDGRPQPGSDPLLEHLTSLRSIELHFKTREPEERIMFPMEDLMAQIKSKPRSIYINLEGACLPEVFRVDAWDLGDLDNALSFQSQYDQLEDVNVKISIYKDSPLEYERAPGTQMVGLVMSAMPEMKERGVLRVKMDYFG